MGGAVKSLAERVLQGLPARWSRHRMSGGCLVLAYHNVVPDGEQCWGDRSLHLPLSSFLAQLDALADTHRVIPLTESLTPSTRATARSKPAAVITFDDAYRGAVRLALPELSRRGLPATVFVSPGRLGDWLWWDLLAADRGLSDDVRRLALDELKGDEARVREWAGLAVPDKDAGPEDRRVSTAGELEAIERLEGISVGSHTWSHPNLARLTDELARGEMSRSRDWLRERFTRAVPWLAYPYGLFGSRTAAMARDMGYLAALRIDGGWLKPPTDPFALPRVNVPSGVSLAGFRLRAAGMR